MKPDDEERILMVLFNEADQKDTDEVLQSPAACAQLDQMEADMQSIEKALNEQHLPTDYGQQLWHQIADQLITPESTQATNNWWQKLQNLMLQPQFSLASFAMVAALVLVAFVAGRQQGTNGIDGQLQEQLLAQNIQLHLTQSEIFLTQVSNGNGGQNMQATAQRLLSSNRIFKQALTNHDSLLTQHILQNLEPVLLEYANSPSQQIHGQQPRANWVADNSSNDLLFQIKAMKQQLAQKNDII